MVLRPILDPIHTLDVILKNDEFSWIFEIFICGSNYSNYEIGRYRPENHDLTSEISSLMLELHYIQNVAGGEVIWPICAIFPQKHPFFGKPTNDFFHLWVSVEYSTPSEISTIEKYGPSAFQRTFERPYSPPRSKVITIWSSKMLLSVSFPEMFHMNVFFVKTRFLQIYESQIPDKIVVIILFGILIFVFIRHDIFIVCFCKLIVSHS